MMPGERPVTVLVFAILNIVFGILGSLCSVCSGMAAVLGMGLLSAAGPGLSIPPLPSGVLTVSIVDYSIMLILAVALSFAGIGLLGMKAWARRLCIALSVLGIVFSVASAIITIGYNNPKMEKWQADMEKRQAELQEQFTRNQQKRGVPQPQINMQSWRSPSLNAAGALVMPILIIAYAITMLVFMLKRDVAAAFFGRGMRRQVKWEDEPQDNPIR